MATFISQYLNLGDELEKLGVFDSLIDEDSNYFINIKLLKECSISEFKNSYNRVNDYFGYIGMLLKQSNSENDKTYRTAYKLFDFSEINGINLGFAENSYGAGFGKKLRKQIIADAYEIIKKGSDFPEIFQLVSLFEENVGPDRLSDMIGTIILEDIVQYTSRINKELQIIPERYTNIEFDNGLVINPYKKCPILLLPISILHELPIARNWDDIDRVVRENEAIKQEINQMVSSNWSKMKSYEKKEHLKKYVFMNPVKCAKVIEAYNNAVVPDYDVYQNSKYNSRRIFEKVLTPNTNFSEKEAEIRTSIQIANEVLRIFKHWIEFNNGNEVLMEISTGQREKVCQRLIHLCAKHYVKVNNMDFSCEANAGRGPVDFKISSGNDKTVIEVKLSSNPQYLHGLKIQIEEYAKAEETDQKIYVLIDVGNPRRIMNIRQQYEEMLDRKENPADLFIIDAIAKKSASVYE